MKKVVAVLSLLLLVMPAAASAPQDPGTDGEICFTFFYSPTCPHCDTVETFVDESRENYSIEMQDHRAAENSELFKQYAESFGVPQERQGYVPAVFIDGEYAIGGQPAVQLLSQKFEEYAGTGLACPSPDSGGGERALTLVGITGLALVDAVNPCALAVLLILLTSILSRWPERKDRALKAGLLFSFAVFAVYFTLGALIVSGFKAATSMAGLSLSGIYQIIGVFAIVIGLFNLKDWISHGSLGFVMEVPFSWRPKMKEFLNSVASPKGAFLTGLIVSLFLLPCTSGPYFVAGGLLSGVGWSTALPFLLFYNLVFILPMVIVTGFVYGGFASVERISDWREENIERLHLFAGIILIGLGLALILGII